MRSSPIKNWLDYFMYGWICAGLMAGAIALLDPAERKFYLLSLVAGVICAWAVSKRDEQHRRVPPSLASSPSRFAAQVEVALDNTLSQLRANEAAAESLSQSVNQFSNALSRATVPQASQLPIGKGFRE